MRNSKTAYLREENLLTLLSQNNFIVPEIQREYVWGNNEKVVVTFLRELKNKVGEICGQCHQPHSAEKINIGFLYSYKPDYVKVKQERFLDENLIDGQQRFTTLFLLLFCLALKEDKKRDFLALIRFEEDLSMSFDFKVRDLTRRFLLEFVQKTETIDQVKHIQERTWFLSDYKNDVSIQAMCKTLNFILNEFDSSAFYYHHFLSNIVFWHFKTEATSQGEELYITMNARGEELADNEITKAAMIPQGGQLWESGKKWEEWQQFFWKNRDKQRVIQSADFGLNSFIACVKGLENYLRLNGDEFSVANEVELLTFDKLERYIESFKYLNSHYIEFKDQYDYAEWVDDCLGTIWSILNKNDTDWFIDFTDQNKGPEQNKMILMWSWLIYLRDKTDEDINLIECFRTLRFFYVRYKNYNRAVAALRQTVALIDINGVFDTVGQDNDASNEGEDYNARNSYRTSNEKLKYTFLNNLQLAGRADIQVIESLIWEIEDHPLNIEGSGLKNLNSSHLVNFDDSLTLQELREVKEKFEELFPIENGRVNFGNSRKLRNVLLCYGAYWQKKWASYYWKYNFGDWKRIIRDMDSENDCFKLFFDDFKQYDSIDELIENIVSEPSYDSETTSELSAFKWYSFKLGEEMWSQGQYIATDHYKYQNADKYFVNFKEMVNMKGTFKGGTPKVLSELITD